MKKPATVFIVDPRTAVASALEAAVKRHHLLAECYSSAALFIADHDVNPVGCVLVDPLIPEEGERILRWLHESDRLLAIVLVSGLIEFLPSAQEKSPLPAAVLKPYKEFALMTMVTDGLAGSISRQVIRERSGRPRQG